MTDFNLFKDAVSIQWSKMIDGHDLYRVAVEKDALWETYLGSFPPGTNPVFRERTEHDCACCRGFVRAVGDVVALVDGKPVSIWDVEVSEPAYRTVAAELSKLVKSAPIANVFLHREPSVGVDENFEDDAGTIRAWRHFHVKIPDRYANRGKNYVRDGKKIAEELGDKRSTHDVLARGLAELTLDALDTTLEIIDQNSLYRGAEFRGVIAAFRDLKLKYDRTTVDDRDAFVWQLVETISPGLARTRNTAIGTLLIDLSDGMDLEVAVHKFETSVMAPTNYRRPTALVSQKMIDAARVAVEELGLTPALERRYARLPDVSVNDVIFADRSVRPAMRDGAFDGLPTKPAGRPKDLSKVEAVSIRDFVDQVVPKVSTIEVLFENEHVNRLVSLVAPVHRDAKPLTKWVNGFSWSYNGDVTDSIKERVKRAGGNVTGDLCCRLAWYNYDDLDLHMLEPIFDRSTAWRIYYGSKLSPRTKGQLDVDMNAGGPRSREPVENIFYPERRRMIEGVYKLEVNQFNKRENIDGGFEVEIDYLGTVTRFAYDKALHQRETIEVAKLRYSYAGGVEIIESLPSRTASREVWGLKTNDFHRVAALMKSPNHWDGEAGTGNLHYFFMLNGCANDGTARGFYNEFLPPELDRHRKVIELVGSKMRVREDAGQLSGLGFSETQRAEVLVRVTGSFTRQLRVQF